MPESINIRVTIPVGPDFCNQVINWLGQKVLVKGNQGKVTAWNKDEYRSYTNKTDCLLNIETVAVDRPAEWFADLEAITLLGNDQEHKCTFISATTKEDDLVIRSEVRKRLKMGEYQFPPVEDALYAVDHAKINMLRAEKTEAEKPAKKASSNDDKYLKMIRETLLERVKNTFYDPAKPEQCTINNISVPEDSQVRMLKYHSFLELMGFQFVSADYDKQTMQVKPVCSEHPLVQSTVGSKWMNHCYGSKEELESANWLKLLFPVADIAAHQKDFKWHWAVENDYRESEEFDQALPAINKMMATYGVKIHSDPLTTVEVFDPQLYVLKTTEEKYRQKEEEQK